MTSEQSITAIAASLLRQLLEAAPVVPPALQDLYRTFGHGRDKLRLNDITGQLQSLCRSQPNDICILLDALDECGPAWHCRQVLSLLTTLLETGVRILVTSRPHVGDVGHVKLEVARLEIRANITDIRTYVEHRLNLNDELRELIGSNMKDEVIQRVGEQADGMYVHRVDSELPVTKRNTNRRMSRFLLAKVQCDHLMQLARRSEIRKALQMLPRGLESAYETTMSRIQLEPPSRKSIALATLSWVYHSKRSLSVDELLHALAVDAGGSSFDEEDIPPGNLVLAVCAGLVVFDTGSSTVRFAHYSVHEYFQTTFQRWFPDGESQIAKSCLAYLSLENLRDHQKLSKEGASKLLSAYPFLKYAAECWGLHVRSGRHSDLDGLLLGFLEDKQRIALAARVLHASDERMRCGSACMDPSDNLAVQLAARFGAVDVLRLLISRGHSICGTDSVGRTALHWAAWHGSIELVRAVLEAASMLKSGTGDAATLVDARTVDGRTPLHWAAKHGRVDVVVELLGRGADPAAATADGRTALHWAASRGHLEVVALLLADPRVDPGQPARNGWTALHWAACSGKRAVAVLGIAEEDKEVEEREQERDGVGEDVREKEKVENDQKDPNFKNRSLSPQQPENEEPDERETQASYEQVVRLLLEAGAYPLERNARGQTAIHLAMTSGNAPVVRLLTDHSVMESAKPGTFPIRGRRTWDSELTCWLPLDAENA